MAKRQTSGPVLNLGQAVRHILRRFYLELPSSPVIPVVVHVLPGELRFSTRS
jgi:hypothetical protein